MTSPDHTQLIKTARLAGIWYLLMAIGGLLGFMIFHSQLFDTESAENTLKNLSEKESLARARLLMEFLIIISQALTAVWFFKLFKGINEWAAWTLGIWGIVNAVAIMVSAISMGAAIDIAQQSVMQFEEKVAMIEVLSSIIKHAWGVGSIFFGLWLIPMGYIVLDSKRMPYWLGLTLVIGGAGYLLNVILNYTGFDGTIAELLVIPATIGEFWMIGYLLIFGIRPEE